MALPILRSTNTNGTTGMPSKKKTSRRDSMRTSRCCVVGIGHRLLRAWSLGCLAGPAKSALGRQCRFMVNKPLFSFPHVIGWSSILAHKGTLKRILVLQILKQKWLKILIKSFIPFGQDVFHLATVASGLDGAILAESEIKAKWKVNLRTAASFFKFPPPPLPFQRYSRNFQRNPFLHILS